MTVKYTEEQAASIRDHMNNARQLNVAAKYWAMSTSDAGRLKLNDAIDGERKRLDKLAEIIDNGEVEETQ